MTDLTKERLDYLLERHFEGKLSEDEALELEAWYDRAQHLNSPLFDGTNPEREDIFKSTVFQGVEQSIHQNQKAFVRKLKPVNRSLFNAAAIIIVFLTITFLIKYINTKDVSSVQPLAQKAAVNIHYQDLVNTTGKAADYYLEDSSRILLYPGSKVRYQKPFAAEKREIHLKGKALFTVKGNPNRPFKVIAGQIATTALGTSFTIIAFKPDAAVNVNLHEGRVLVEMMDQPAVRRVFLSPGQELSINLLRKDYLVSTPKNSDIKVKKPALVADTDTLSGLTMAFEQEPLTEVLSAIASGYKVKIQFREEDMKEILFSGNINSKDKLRNVLDRIAILNELIITKDSGNYIIRKNQ